MVYFIQSSQKSYNNKYNTKHMKEQMLDDLFIFHYLIDDYSGFFFIIII